MMNLSQTKLVGLTMELDLKAREHKMLCDKLEQLKNSNIDPNDEKLLHMMQLFQKSYNEIIKINQEIKQIKKSEKTQEHSYSNNTFYKKEIKESNEKHDLKKSGEKYNQDNIIKNNKEEQVVENTNLPSEIKKETFFMKLISYIKGLFNKTN